METTPACTFVVMYNRLASHLVGGGGGCWVSRRAGIFLVTIHVRATDVGVNCWVVDLRDSKNGYLFVHNDFINFTVVLLQLARI